MQTNDQTAILLFSRSSRQEALHKQLAGSRSYQVSQTLLRHVVREARKTGLPLCTCFSPQQHGRSFGERLANATEAVFAQGYQRILIIGSDSPGLEASLLVKANQQLESHSTVLGPAEDGGLYLIGLTAAAYDRAFFVSLPWETAHLQPAFAAQLVAAEVSTCYLAPLIDLDTPQHFADWHPTLVSGRLRLELRRCLVELQQLPVFLYHLLPRVCEVLMTNTPRRGPPLSSY